MRVPTNLTNKAQAVAAVAGPLFLIEPARGVAMVELLLDVPIDASYVSGTPRRSDEGYEVSGRSAIVRMSGPMAKDPGSLAQIFDGVCSTTQVRRQMRHAAARDDIDNIVLVIDSPGGQVSGTRELATDVQRIAESKKPVLAYIEDYCCSAALWVAVHATTVVASPYATIGSIGTYCVLYDSSDWAEKLGLKAHLISSGGVKGHPSVGVPITDEALGKFQSMVDRLTTDFVSAVAEARGLDPDDVKGMATGETWTAEEALAKGLIDGVALWDDLEN